jgi:succinylglutamate desuccinylase
MSSAIQVNPAHFKSITVSGRQPGPRLIVTGAVHGNETCGTKAILRLLEELDSGALSIASGSVTLVPVTNPLAYARVQRMGDRNLNRNLYPIEAPGDFEDHIANWLCPLLAAHDVLLDLHSFQSGSEAFAMVGPVNNSDALQPFAHAEAEEEMARHLGVRRFVDGWLDTYATGVGRRLQEAARGAPLNPLNTEALSIYDVIDKAHDDDSFSRAWISFDPLVRGDLIGTRADGTQMIAECDGFIVFPNSKAQAGNEWYYLAKLNHRFAA